MITYAIFITVLLGGALFIDRSLVRNTRKLQLIYAGIVIVLFWGSVDALDFGTDIMNYYNNARTALRMGYNDYLDICAFEDGYATFIWVISHIFKNPQALLFVQYTFITVIVFRFIYLNSKDVFLSLVVYICLGTFGFCLYAFRQAMAITICLIAYESIKKKHYVRAILIILFASMFHQTAIVFLPVILLQGKQIRVRNVVGFSSAMLVFTLFLEQFVAYGNELFEMGYGSGYQFTSYTGALINIGVDVTTMLMLLLKYKNTDKKYTQIELEKISVLVFMGIIALMLYVCRFYVLALERVAYYFIPAYIILIPEGLAKKTDKWRISKLSFLFVACAVLLFLIRSRSSLGTYNSIWF